ADRRLFPRSRANDNPAHAGRAASCDVCPELRGDAPRVVKLHSGLIMTLRAWLRVVVAGCPKVIGWFALDGRLPLRVERFEEPPRLRLNRRIVGRHVLRTSSLLLLRLHAALHLLGRDVLDVRADRPRVAPPVGDGRHAIAVELVRRLAPRLPARRQRLLVGGVHVGHVEIGADPRRWVFGIGVGEHQHGVSHAYFGMADLSARSGKAIYLVAAERLLEKVDEVGRALDDEVRRERVVALGNWLDRHGASLSEEAPSYHNRHALAWSVRSSFQNPSRASGSATFPRSDRNR